MATLTVQNLTNDPVYIGDLYTTIQPNAAISTRRSTADLTRMAALQAALAAGTVAASVELSPDEQASGLLSQGLAQGAATGTSPEAIVRVPLTAGVGGGPDDVLVYPLNGLPAAKVRILSVYADISTPEDASVLQVYTSTGGDGTLCGEVSSAAAGRATQDSAVIASQVITNGSTVGLWVHRSNNLVVGEVFITLRPEV